MSYDEHYTLQERVPGFPINEQEMLPRDVKLKSINQSINEQEDTDKFRTSNNSMAGPASSNYTTPDCSSGDTSSSTSHGYPESCPSLSSGQSTNPSPSMAMEYENPDIEPWYSERGLYLEYGGSHIEFEHDRVQLYNSQTFVSQPSDLQLLVPSYFLEGREVSSPALKYDDLNLRMRPHLLVGNDAFDIRGFITDHIGVTSNASTGPLEASSKRHGQASVGFEGLRSILGKQRVAPVRCKFFKQGACKAGKTCPFSHDLNKTVEKGCQYFAKGNCKFGDKCANKHVPPATSRDPGPTEVYSISPQGTHLDEINSVSGAPTYTFGEYSNPWPNTDSDPWLPGFSYDIPTKSESERYKTGNNRTSLESAYSIEYESETCQPRKVQPPLLEVAPPVKASLLPNPALSVAVDNHAEKFQGSASPVVYVTNDFDETDDDIQGVEMNSTKESESSDFSDDECTAEQSDFSSTTSGSTSNSELSPLKRALIDRVMEEFWALFDAGMSPVPENNVDFWNHESHLREHKGEPSESRSGSPPNTLSGSNGDSRTSSGKRRLPSEEPPDDDQGEDQKRRRVNPQFSLSSENFIHRRYACQFHQHDPSRYCSNEVTGHKYRTCGGPGWDDVHRIKEHLYRCHVAPIVCSRCYIKFKTKSELNAHTRCDEVCEKKEARKIDGIDEDMMRQLKRRKRSNNEGNEDERWREIYRLLFPGKIVPSPFYNDQPLSPSSRQFAEFEEYSKQELPRLVRSGLESLVSEEMQPMEESLKAKLMDVIREAQQSLLDKFKTDHGASRGTSTMASPSGQSSAANMPLLNQVTADNFPTQSILPSTSPQDGPVSQEHLELDLVSPPTPINDFDLDHDLDLLLRESAPGGEYTDSGYGTQCTCQCSEQSIIEPGPSDLYKAFGQKLDATDIDVGDNEHSNPGSDLKSWLNFEPPFPDFGFAEFMFAKCDRCGGDKGLGELVDTSIPFEYTTLPAEGH